MNGVGHIIDRLEAMEGTMRSLDTVEMLYKMGVIKLRDDVTHAGDWDVSVWSHSADDAFTVGFMRRVRRDGLPFPMHQHNQKLWLLASKGCFVVKGNGEEFQVGEGGYLIVEPCAPHEVFPVSEECVVLFILIPADTGYCGCIQKN